MARESVDSICQKAQRAIAEGKSEQARQLYLQALGLRSDLPNVHYGLATVCFLLNDLPSAAYHFKEVTRLDPLRAGAFINLGAVYNRLEQLDEAITALRRGIQLDHGKAEGYYNLGVAYRKQGQLDLAIQAYREATRVNPRMADAHYNLGNLYLEKGQYTLAITHYNQALDLRPGWEKAERGLEQAEENARANDPGNLQPAVDDVPGEEQTEEDAFGARDADSFDPERTIDPNVHGALIGNLHRATIESEGHGRTLLGILENEIEPAIKVLSSCLLYPSTAITELDLCVQKMETAIASMRNVQRSLQTSMEKVRTTGEKLLTR
jgi:tetratricopeptide (TPR) repeat protein